MSAPSNEWHAEAKRLHAAGLSPISIAKQLQRTRSAVYWALDLNNHRARQRGRVEAQRKELVGTRKRGPVLRSPESPVVEVSPEPTQPRRPTLPHISMPDLGEPDGPRVLRFAPRTLLTGSAGAERIRDIHRRMIRQGRIAEPGVTDQLHH